MTREITDNFVTSRSKAHACYYNLHLQRIAITIQWAITMRISNTHIALVRVW